MKNHDNIRAVLAEVRRTEHEHKIAWTMLQSLGMDPPQWARDAVRSSHDAMIEAQSKETKILAEVLS